MKAIINTLSKHPVVYSCASLIILIFCLGPLQKLHPLLMIAIFVVTPFIFVFMPFFANALDPVKIEAIKDKNDVLLSDDNLGSTIKVLERKPANRRVLSLVRHRESYSKYNPASATFSAATVGGITTGGWDVKDAHYSTAMGGSTDKYLLCYTPDVYNKNKCSLLSSVILTQKDAEAARKQGFGKYLNGNTLVLQNTGKWKNSKYATNVYAKTGDFYAASNYLVKDYTASLLTQPEMQKILDFLCDDNEKNHNSIINEVGKKYPKVNVWVCKACGAKIEGDWSVDCPNCHSENTLKRFR